jgi:heme/copper-type cytochrome/quinol oxidase subunit 3
MKFTASQKASFAIIAAIAAPYVHAGKYCASEECSALVRSIFGSSFFLLVGIVVFVLGGLAIVSYVHKKFWKSSHDEDDEQH